MTGTDGAWYGPLIFLVEFFAFIAICAVLGRALDRRIDRRLRRHTRRALDRGDQQIRLAVDEAAAAHHDRQQRGYTVPRQLTSGRTPR